MPAGSSRAQFFETCDDYASFTARAKDPHALVGQLDSCLANGRPEAAAFLATRGARLDLEGASGVGRLDVVRTFFNDDGTFGSSFTGSRCRRNGCAR